MNNLYQTIIISQNIIDSSNDYWYFPVQIQHVGYHLFSQTVILTRLNITDDINLHGNSIWNYKIMKIYHIHKVFNVKIR